MARVIQFLEGGLGNQLFQYAHAYSLSREYGYELSVFSAFNYLMPGSRENGLKYFEISGSYNKNIPIEVWGHSLKHIIGTYGNILRKKKHDDNFAVENKRISTIKETKKHYHSICLPPNKDYYLLEGFWQSELYFEKYSKDLLEMFVPSKPYLEKVMKRSVTSSIVQNTNSVSLHIRRGDFSKIGWVLDPCYYEKAISVIKDRINNPTFFVFSDDIEWCKLHFIEENNFVFVESSGCLAYEDMYLMSLCRHNVVANSTYSWWGAYLNRNKSKTVIAPKEIINFTNENILSELKWVII